MTTKKLVKCATPPFPPMFNPTPKNCGRMLYLSGEVNEGQVTELNMELLRLQREDPLQDITLIIDSYGGELFAAFALVDMMNIITCDISTICIGKAMSAGQFIFSQGAPGKRFMTKHARLMIHNPLAGMEGSFPDIEVEIEELKKVREIFVRQIASRSNQTVEQVKDLIQRNKYLSADEAIEYGFADRIINRLAG